MLPVMNYSYLYAVQEHSLFISGHTFMMEKLSVPGGLLEWIGCYCTQFFYYPWLGSAMLIIIWLTSLCVTAKTFHLNGIGFCIGLIPICALLCSIIDLGYWLYYINNLGYWFSESIGYLILIISVFVFSKLVEKTHRLQEGEERWRDIFYLGCSSGFLVVWSILGYIAFGWWGLLGSLVMGIKETSTKPSPCVSLWILPSLACVCVVPSILYQFYTHFRFDHAWFVGFPIFQQGNFVDWKLSVPFFVIIAFVLTMAIISRWHCMENSICKKKSARFVTLCVFLGICIIIPLNCNFSDENYHSELRLYRAVEECRWQDVIDEFEEHQDSPTQQMVMCKNLALINLGLLGEKMFALNNNGVVPNSGKLKVSMIVTAGSLLYYYNGLVNYAYRWAIENEVKHGLSVKQLKMLARCAVWKDEVALAMKYITMLRSTTFYKKWAKQREKMIANISDYRDNPEYNAVSPLEISGDGELDIDNGQCMEYIISNYAYLIPQNLIQCEVAVCYAMMLKDDELIKYQLENYYSRHSIENVPKHILEIVDIYNENHTVGYQKFILDYQTKLGKGHTLGEVGKTLKPLYRTTYWWYYYFVNDFATY